MAGPSPTLASPRLRRLAQRPSPLPEQQELCELCGEALPGRHRHLLDLETRQLLCACRACSLLFDRRAAGGGHYRLVPDRRTVLDRFELGDLEWEQLQIPVDMAFFFHSSVAGRVMAFYPSPMGATESRLELGAWQSLEQANPVLATMEPDVEALLVNRAKGARRQWLVPIEDCYRLVAVIRTQWRGFTGGKEVWLGIERFFAELDRRARPHTQATDRR
ncbi:MAG: DUF5947 family protein [Actinomycetota bacterium]|nr:DUF5947 family protein [Actinomycetota bacterium]